MITLWQGLVPVDSIDTVTERVARVAKRAEKVGFPVPSIVLGATKREHQSNGTFVEYIDLSIQAAGPLKLGDYILLGVVSELADGSPFVTYVPGVGRVDNPVKVNYCDHCKKVRNRTNTYLVVHTFTDPLRPEAGLLYGALSQVGSSCVKDFLGYDPALFAAYLKSIEDLSWSDEEISSMGMAATKFYRPDVIMQYAARIVAAVGYVNKQKAESEDIPSTGELVREFLSATPRQHDEMGKRYPLNDDALALVDATIEAVTTEHATTSDWEADVIRLAGSGGVQWRHVGIVASGIILGLRTRERKATPQGESEFIGMKGERLDLEVTVMLKRPYENDYGTGYVIRMTQFGTTNDLLWFGSGQAAVDMEEGRTYRIKGTVKNHELDKRTERPTTLLTRVNLAD